MPLRPLPGRTTGAVPVSIALPVDIFRPGAPPPPARPDIFSKIEGWINRGSQAARSVLDAFSPRQTAAQPTPPEPGFSTNEKLGVGFLVIALGLLIGLGGFARRRG